jgi:hypothetical protein
VVRRIISSANKSALGAAIVCECNGEPIASNSDAHFEVMVVGTWSANQARTRATVVDGKKS